MLVEDENTSAGINTNALSKCHEIDFSGITAWCLLDKTVIITGNCSDHSVELVVCARYPIYYQRVTLEIVTQISNS